MWQKFRKFFTFFRKFQIFQFVKAFKTVSLWVVQTQYKIMTQYVSVKSCESKKIIWKYDKQALSHSADHPFHLSCHVCHIFVTFQWTPLSNDKIWTWTLIHKYTVHTHYNSARSCIHRRTHTYTHAHTNAEKDMHTHRYIKTKKHRGGERERERKREGDNSTHVSLTVTKNNLLIVFDTRIVV